ncbi:hypothetical protein ACOMHN_032959 [Nucella lapillus]
MMMTWKVAVMMMTGLSVSTVFGSSAVCRRHRPCPDTRDNVTSYVSIIDELVGKLEWSRVVVIMEKSADFDVDPIVGCLHTKYISTTVVERDVTTGHKNMTSPMILTDDVFQPMSASSGGGCFLVLGSDDFVRQLFHEIVMFINETSEKNRVTRDYASRRLRRKVLVTSEWLTVADVSNLEDWNTLLSPLEHVLVIDRLKQQRVSLWTSQRQGDSTALGHVLTVSCTAALGAVTRHSLLPNLHQGLSGRTLRVAIRQEYYLVRKVKGTRGRRMSIQGYQGAFIDLMEELSLRLNFSYRLLEPRDHSWGQKKDDGQWDGLIGVLTREEADLALSGFRLILDRALVADYTKPYGFEHTMLVYRSSGQPDYDDSFFLRPLRRWVYVAIGLSMLCVLLLMMLGRWTHWCTRWEGGSSKAEGGVGRAEVIRWLMADMMAVVAGLLNRWQVVMVTWLFVSVVVVSGLYSSQLTASLTVRDNRPPFTSMEELVHQHAYTWGVINGTATQTILKKSHNPIYRKFYKGSVYPHGGDHIKKILQGRYAFLTGSTRPLNSLQSRYCHVRGIHVRGLLKPAVFFLQKHSPYTQLFSDT